MSSIPIPVSPDCGNRMSSLKWSLCTPKRPDGKAHFGSLPNSIAPGRPNSIVPSLPQAALDQMYALKAQMSQADTTKTPPAVPPPPAVLAQVAIETASPREDERDEPPSQPSSPLLPSPATPANDGHFVIPIPSTAPSALASLEAGHQRNSTEASAAGFVTVLSPRSEPRLAESDLVPSGTAAKDATLEALVSEKLEQYDSNADVSFKYPDRAAYEWLLRQKAKALLGITTDAAPVEESSEASDPNAMVDILVDEKMVCVLLPNAMADILVPDRQQEAASSPRSTTSSQCSSSPPFRSQFSVPNAPDPFSLTEMLVANMSATCTSNQLALAVRALGQSEFNNRVLEMSILTKLAAKIEGSEVDGKTVATTDMVHLLNELFPNLLAVPKLLYNRLIELLRECCAEDIRVVAEAAESVSDATKAQNIARAAAEKLQKYDRIGTNCTTDQLALAVRGLGDSDFYARIAVAIETNAVDGKTVATSDIDQLLDDLDVRRDNKLLRHRLVDLLHECCAEDIRVAAVAFEASSEAAKAQNVLRAAADKLAVETAKAERLAVERAAVAKRVAAAENYAADKLEAEAEATQQLAAMIAAGTRAAAAEAE